MNRYFRYVDEFMSLTIEEYLTILLKDFRLKDNSHGSEEDKLISQFILRGEILTEKNTGSDQNF